MPQPLTLDPRMIQAILYGKKSFTRRPMKIYHRLLARPVRVVSVLARGLENNPPVLWQVGTTIGVKFTRLGGAVYYRWKDGMVQLQTKAQVEDDTPDIWLVQHEYQPLRLEVTALFREPLAAMNNTSAQQEGFDNLADFKAFWKSKHGGWSDGICYDGQVWALAIKHAPQEEVQNVG